MKRALVTLVVLGVLGGAGYLGYVAYKKFDDERNARKWDEIKKIEEQGQLASGEIGKLIRDMNDASIEVQLAAAIALGQMGDKAVAPLREKLKTGNKSVRYNAALALAMIGPAAAPAVDELLVCAADSAPDVRYKALYALGKVGADSPAAIDALVAALDDSDASVSATAQEALQSVGAAGKAPLYQSLAKAKGPARGRILAIVGALGAPPKEAAPVLKEIAEEPDTGSRMQAVLLLGFLGDDAVPTYKKLLTGEDPRGKELAVQGFKNLGPAGKALLPDLGAVLAKSDDYNVVTNGMLACKALEGDGAATLAKLLADDLDAKPRPWTPTYLATLGEIGAPAKVAVPVLTRYLFSGDFNHVNQALDALGSIGPAAREAALPALEKLRAANLNLGPRIDQTLRRMGVIPVNPEKGGPGPGS